MKKHLLITIRKKVEMMTKIISEWDVTGEGDYILTLNNPIPKRFYNHYRIDGKDYDIVPVSFSNINNFCTIGLKEHNKINFIGKKIEFVTI